MSNRITLKLNPFGQFQLNFLVVDDEQLLRQDIIALLKKKSIPASCIYEVKSGNEALEILQRVRIDIIILDIKMPGLSGLELLERIHRPFPDIKTIIISGYAEFEYAKQALCYGTAEYLLKPIDDQIFFDAVDKVTAQLKSATKHTLLHAIEDEFYKQTAQGTPSVPLLDNGFWGKDIRLTMHVLLVNPRDSELTQEEVLFNLSNLLHTVTQTVDCALFFQNKVNQNELILLCLTNNLLPRPYKADYLIREILQVIHDCNLSGIFIGGTKTSVPPDQILAGYDCCLTALKARFLGQNAQLFYADPKPDSEKTDLSAGYPPSVQSLLDIFLKSTSFNPAIATRIFSTEHILLLSVKQMKSLFQLMIAKHTHWQPMENTLNQFNTVAELIRYIEETYPFDNKELGDISELIKSISADIRQNYEKDISLTSLSEKYHINPNYLSEIFKEKSGVNFKDFLCEIRLTKAIELLSKTNMSIKNISISIGYHSQGYFQKVFKRHYNCTPLEFRENGGF